MSAYNVRRVGVGGVAEVEFFGEMNLEETVPAELRSFEA